jgi:predicted nucleic acid-binding Zn ribbon protein
LEEAHYKSLGVIKDTDNKKRKCLICQTVFVSEHGKNTCSAHCKEELLASNRKKLNEQALIKEENDTLITIEAKKWLNKKKRDTKMAVPFHELSKRSEYSRVFGKYSEATLYFKRKGFGKR